MAEIDLVALVTGIAADLGARRMPGADTQRWIDGHVADRRDRSLEWLVFLAHFPIPAADLVE